MIKKILVPIDGSAQSKKALEFACELLPKFNANLYLLTVLEIPAEGRVMVMGTSRVAIQTDQSQAEKQSKSVLEAASQVAIDNNCKVNRADILTGSAAHEILGYVKKNDIDTIIIGSRGLSDIGGLLMGSVSHKVNHLATCTCITVR